MSELAWSLSARVRGCAAAAGWRGKVCHIGRRHSSWRASVSMHSTTWRVSAASCRKRQPEDPPLNQCRTHMACMLAACVRCRFRRNIPNMLLNGPVCEFSDGSTRFLGNWNAGARAARANACASCGLQAAQTGPGGARCGCHPSTCLHALAARRSKQVWRRPPPKLQVIVTMPPVCSTAPRSGGLAW